MKFVKYFDKTTYIKTVGTENNEESLTDQSFVFDADINNLVGQYLNGMAPRTPVREPVYDMNNYETSSWQPEDWHNQKAMIERKFLHLSPEMKAKFVTPANFFKYCSNPDNYIMTDEGIKEKPKEDYPTIIPEVSQSVQSSTQTTETK